MEKYIGIEKVGTLCRTENESSFDLHLERFKDDLLRLYFVDSEMTVPNSKERIGHDSNSIGFRIWDSEVMLLGVTVKKEQRGESFSHVLIDSFFEFVKEMGFIFEKTGTINKPIMAKTMKKYGFSAESDDVVVEILPQPQGTCSRTPKVRKVEFSNFKYGIFPVMTSICTIFIENSTFL